MSMESLLDTATSRHRAGDLAAARRIYREVLDAEPLQPTALLRGGLLEWQDGRADLALDLLERAAAAAPSDPRIGLALGQVLQAQGRHGEAAQAYRRALQNDPDSVDLRFSLGMALESMGEFAGAIAAYETAVRLDCTHFPAFNNLGNCRQRGGDIGAAVTAYERALSLRPDAAGVIANLGTALLGLNRIDEAVGLLRKAAALEPAVAAHSVNLGIALCRRRDHAAAAALLEEVLAREPANADAAFNCGLALHGLGRLRESVDRYRQAAALRPEHADTFINLGNACRQLGEVAAARAAYGTALRLAPDSVPAMNNAAALERSVGRFDEAEDLLRAALRLDPRRATLHDTLGSVLKDAGDIDGAVECFRRAVELDPSDSAAHGNLVYALSFQTGRPRIILEEALAWDRKFAAHLAPAADVASTTPSTPAVTAHAAASAGGALRPPRRLRIGYVSADFRQHCQALFMIPLLTQHDRGAVQVYCYSSVERPDALTVRFAALADVWRDVRTLDDETLAALVREDAIDILVDLTMHMARGRPLLFARKPAPVQVAWLAYPGTTGLSAIDYRLTDPRLDPPGADIEYRERSIRLPDAFWCYDPLTAEPPVNALPAATRGYVTFGCLNNPCKLTDETLRLWGGVMRAVEDARLVLLAPRGRQRARLSRRLAARGIDPARVDFLEYRPRDEYLRAFHDIDVSLDTVPYNGHTTGLDSLWMGVPTVTRVAGGCAGRGGLSQLHQLGLLDLIADDDARFVAAAAGLARDLPRLAELRRTLRARLEASPLMDAPRFARNIEHAYRTMWRQHRAEHPDVAGCIIRHPAPPFSLTTCSPAGV